MEILKPWGNDYLWGEIRLRGEYGKKIDLAPLAETWELSMFLVRAESFQVRMCLGGYDQVKTMDADPKPICKGETIFSAGLGRRLVVWNATVLKVLIAHSEGGTIW